MDANTCIMCGAVVPEGRQVCMRCEADIRARRAVPTRRELETLRRLKMEIGKYDAKIAKLRAAATSITTKLRMDGGCGGGISDKTGIGADIAYWEQRAAEEDLRASRQYRHVIDWIEAIEDVELRQIFRYRFVEGKKWAAVAREMGSLGDGSTQKKRVYRYLK